MMRLHRACVRGLTLCVPVLLQLLAVSHALCGSSMEYGVVFDVGSSGSRVVVFRWPLREDQDAIPNVTQVYKYKKKPGFSSLQGQPSLLRPYILDLLKNAIEHVPEVHHSSSSIYFLATAGMRMLEEGDANSMMAAADRIFSDVTVNPFRYDSLNTRVLSGEEEGAFAWLALNYLTGYFTGGTPDAVGVMELGGASTQIAFIPEGSPLAGKFPVRLGGVEYPLYVHSYLYYGQEYSLLWTAEYLARQNPGVSRIDHPCLLAGDEKLRVLNGTNVILVGASDPAGCQEIVEEYIYEADPNRCHPKPCAIGPTYQPSIPELMTFYATAAFNYPIDAYGLTGGDGCVSPRDLLEEANKYCVLTLDEAAQQVDQGREFLSANCQDGIYSAILFTKAYGFHQDTHQIKFVDDIQGVHVSWALGNILYASAENPVPCSAPAVQAALVVLLSTLCLVRGVL